MPDLPFTCEKRPASGALGVVVCNAPLGAAAGAEMLAAGGNAVDAAVAALFALTVVEPMMVGIAGGGIAHLRLANGRHLVIDAMSTAPATVRPDAFTPAAGAAPFSLEVEGRRNTVGAQAVAVPGNLRGWCAMVERYGRLPLSDVLDPAIRVARRGFPVSAYLHGAIREHLADLAADPETARVLLDDGEAPAVGSRLAMPDYAESLALIRAEGARALHGGALGAALVEAIAAAREPGWLSARDLHDYAAPEREAIFSSYRGHEIVGPPPPASSGVHVAEMLNILEGYDLGAMAFASAERLHLLAEVMRIGFEDRRAASGDPAFVDVPVARYVSKAYAAEARGRIRASGGAGALTTGREGADTTHVTVADRDGNIVAATHTLNGLFGARFMVPGTGVMPNNYMLNFDPVPGRALSIAPGKRVPTSMAPMIVLRDDRPVYALGLPGGVRIFPSAMQAIVNLIDHGMSLQQAVEAPRIWTEGAHVELEPAYAGLAAGLQAKGHEVQMVKTIGGGMNAVELAPDGMLTGAACWRADGTVAALGGGLARPGIRFVI